MKQFVLVFCMTIATCLCCLSGASADQETPQSKVQSQYKVILQMSDADPKKWITVLNNIKNVQEELGKANTTIELVAFGPGIGMLKADAEVASRINVAAVAGVKFLACEHTMKGQKLTAAEMNPVIGYVSSGVVEIIKQQQAGYVYVHP